MAGIDAVRAYCGWHIAPSTSETVQVEGEGSRILLLPSLHVTDTTEVRNEDGDVVEGWKVRQNGVARGTWTLHELYEFDIVHGYDEMPAEVQEIIDGIDANGPSYGSLTQKTIGPFTESYDPTSTLSVRAVLDRYRLPERP